MSHKSNDTHLDSKDDYILSLETTIELLKRDIAKSKSDSAGLSYQQNDMYTAYFDTISKLKKTDNTSEIYDLINDFLYNYFDFYEFNFYTFKENLITPIFMVEENTLEDKVDNMIEQGIIDWIFGINQIKIIPDLFDEQTNKTTFLAIIPIILSAENLGFLVARVDNQIHTYNQNELDIMYNLTFEYTVRLKYESSNLEINKLQNQVNLLSQEIASSTNSNTFIELSGLYVNELNYPIRKIDSNLKLMKRGLGNLEVRTKLIEKEISNIKDLNEKYQNVLQGLAVQKTKATETIDINDAVSEVLSFIKGQLLHQDIELEFLSHPSALSVDIDKLQLEKIILIIIKFAKLKMPDGGKLQIITNNVGRYYNHITIIDNGLGYSTEEVKQLFMPGAESQMEQTELINKYSKRKHLKLNSDESLFVAKSIIENYKGKISIVSDLGVGTTFKIQIPKKKQIKLI